MPSSSSLREEIAATAKAIAQSVDGSRSNLDYVQAEVLSVETNTVTLAFGGDHSVPVPDCRVVNGYTPTAGDTVDVLFIDKSTVIVLGKYVRSNFAPPGPAATLSVTPSSQLPSGSIHFSGAHWTPGTVVITFDSPAVTLVSPTADGSGNISANASVPMSAAAGAHTITATQGALTATVSFTVGSPGAATIVVTPTSSYGGDYVGLSGSGWTPGGGVSVLLDSSTGLTGLDADGSGNISGVAIIPTSASTGSHTIQAHDGTLTAQCPFTVIAPETDPLAGHDSCVPNVPSSVAWGFFRDPSCTLLSDGDVTTIMSNLMGWLGAVVCPAWSRHVPTFAFYSSEAAIPDGEWHFGFYGDTGGGPFVGVHSSTVASPTSPPVPFAKVWTSASGTPFSRAAIERTASHEAAEMIADPGNNGCGEYIAKNTSTNQCYVVENGDPVEGHGYVSAAYGSSQTFSDFCLPSYFTVGSSGPWDYLSVLTAPFTVDGGRSVLIGSC